MKPKIVDEYRHDHFIDIRPLDRSGEIVKRTKNLGCLKAKDGRLTDKRKIDNPFVARKYEFIDD